MTAVWVTFLVTAAVLLALAVVATRWRGGTAPVIRIVGRFLFVLAATTSLFPMLLARIGPAAWAATYIGFVVTLTVVMTVAAVVRARTLRT